IGVFTSLSSIPYRFCVIIHETQLAMKIIKALLPEIKYGIQYNSVGKYNAYHNVQNNGNKRRKIATYSYLKPEMAMIEENVNTVSQGLSSIRVNNWSRESSVYLKLDHDPTFGIPTVTDNSRFNIAHRGSSTAEFKYYENKRFYKDVASFYASIKQSVANQYGSIYNIEYIDVDACVYDLKQTYKDCDLGFFGGDTFIGRFAIKRKHSYFLQT